MTIKKGKVRSGKRIAFYNGRQYTERTEYITENGRRYIVLGGDVLWVRDEPWGISVDWVHGARYI